MAPQRVPSMRRNERGAVLGLALFTALIASFASLAVLQLAISQTQHAKFHHDRTRSRYAAEAGIVYAQQQLLANPGYCGTGGLDINGISVDVTVTDCGAGKAHTVSAKVVY